MAELGLDPESVGLPNQCSFPSATPATRVAPAKMRFTSYECAFAFSHPVALHMLFPVLGTLLLLARLANSYSRQLSSNASSPNSTARENQAETRNNCLHPCKQHRTTTGSVFAPRRVPAVSLSPCPSGDSESPLGLSPRLSRGLGSTDPSHPQAHRVTYLPGRSDGP